MIPINQDELIQLNEYYHQNTSSCFCIYGSSKSGKTTFLRDFIIKKNFLYFEAYNATSSLLFDFYINIINKKFHTKHSSRYYNSFESILSLLNEQEYKEKTAIIFDNFHEILKVDKNAIEDLIKYYTKSFKKKSIQLICTFNTTQYKEKFNKINTKSIFLKPFAFQAIEEKAALSPTDKFYIYSIFGASSYFLSFYNTKIELTKNVYQIVFQPNSPFYNYGFEYLQNEFGEIGTFASILYAISIGHHKIGQIAEFLDLPSSYLTRYIQKLQDKMIIKKELPIKKTNKTSKYGRYYINDNFMRFWFCYVYPNISYLNIKRHTSILKTVDNTIITNIITPYYKRYITDLIVKNPSKYLGFQPNTIGPWWDNMGNNIDLIAYDDNEIVFINIYWETKEQAMLHYDSLRNMSTKFKTKLKISYLIISKNSYLSSQQKDSNE